MYTTCQEGTRKYIEHVFGILKGKFQFVSRPIHMYHLQQICNRLGTCLMLHNMAILDRVMGDCNKRYNPMETMVGPDDPYTIEYPSDIAYAQDKFKKEFRIPNDTWKVQYERKLDRWHKFEDNYDYTRLYKALLSGH